jgi:hypothetical protein
VIIGHVRGRCRSSSFSFEFLYDILLIVTSFIARFCDAPHVKVVGPGVMSRGEPKYRPTSTSAQLPT